MASEPCDVCEKNVRIAGGIGDLWNFAFESTQGMTLELADGSEHFLCFDCMERLQADAEPMTEADAEPMAEGDADRAPADAEEPTAEDVADLKERVDPVEEEGNEASWPWNF